ncbi:long-chain-fatty-acid--CoA ligase [Rhizohabitans arisaemae]|uniref:long-chain-fatty-acid--CoA ligase n=1 Tax=Rhizohabitans arisaemae TaxID=2720610 RepID=UPI0024B10D9F|nr:long-chain-fatty-acid--CoA ligase [Rhizohabitans arisaemae]
MYLTQGLHRSLQQNPDAPATIFGDRVRTVRELADRVSRLAAALRAMDVADGERVGVLALNSDRFAEILLAVPWTGGVVNPVNIRWSPAEIVYSLAECQTDILFVDDAFAAYAPVLRQGYPALRKVVHIGDGPLPEGMLDYEELIAAHEPIPDVRRGGDSLLGIFYTGGTTGFPKGAMISHANLFVATYGSRATAPTGLPGGKSLLVAPMFHMAAFAAWYTQLVLGGTHVIVPFFEPGTVIETIARHRVSYVMLVPTMIQMLVDHPSAAEHDLSCVRHVVYGASPISETLLRQAMRTFPRAEFVQAYGMTELAPAATLLTSEDHREGTRLRSAGRAAMHAEVAVVGPDDQVLPPGRVGEVVVRGGHVMLGYWNKPAETAEALRGGWMHTGDGGYLDEDGYLHIVDRIKDMIISGGENVYSAEVENALAAHPAVALCAVIGIPDAVYGERVHAVIKLKPGATATLAEIRDHCKSLIAGYKAPRSCEFVEDFPLSAAGKILKRELRKPYWEEKDRTVQ